MLRAAHAHTPAYLQVLRSQRAGVPAERGEGVPNPRMASSPPASCSTQGFKQAAGCLSAGSRRGGPTGQLSINRGGRAPGASPAAQGRRPPAPARRRGGRAGYWCPTVAGPRGRGQPQVNDWPGLREKSLARFLTTARDRRLGSAPRPRPPLQKKTPGGGHAGSRLSRRERGCSLGGGIFFFFLQVFFRSLESTGGIVPR